MKAAEGCKLFGAHQALSGIQDSVAVLHSVVGCNFGSLAFHTACDMADIRQTCTVISDSDVIFGGEASLARALGHVEELYHPEVIFVITGCISDIIQDDVRAVAEHFSGKAQIVTVEAAGYRGGTAEGYEAGSEALAQLMAPQEKKKDPVLNLIGLGADDPGAVWDRKAVEGLLGEKARLGTVISRCRVRRLRQAPDAGLNVVLGRGTRLAGTMERRFGVPWREIAYPYGVTGAEELWALLEEQFRLDFSAERRAFRTYTAEGLKPAYAYLQALYGMPAAVIGTRAKCRGMERFLTRELGMEVVCRAVREELEDLEEFYDQVRNLEAAVLFGSSFEAELAEELGIALIRFDYPVFDRFHVAGHPYVGAEGTLRLVEDILNEVMSARTRKGALYQ